MKTELRRAAAAAFVVSALAACGGGGGNSVTTGGGSQGPVVSMPDPVSVSLERERGPAAVKVLERLQIHASGGPWYSGDNREFTWSHHPGLPRYAEPPTVRVAEGTTDHQRAMPLHAVAMVNRALPYESHIRIGPDAPPLAPMDDVPDGEIFVDFALHDDWLPLPDPNFKPTGQSAHHFVIEDGRKVGQRAAHVWIDERLDPADRVTISTMVHELIHAVGLSGHVSPSDDPTSFVRETLPPFETQLGAIDVAALQVLYTRLDVATAPEELTLDSLGPWDDETINLHGAIGVLSFGVRHHNGISVPWTEGSDPATALADNRALRGTATWNGGLVGFTPDLHPVAGKAEIGFDLATFAGRADFTELQSWPEGEAPGALGTGTIWNAGSLGYPLAVGGNYIRSTNGDDGALYGRFYGRGHEGVGGTVERRDLTAAFGATRR